MREPRTPSARLTMALVGWPPLGLAAAALIGESTGCGRFAASCSELSGPVTWIVQVAIVLLLLALPRLAAWSARGTLAVIVVGALSAVVLSAGGGSREPDASNTVLLAILAVAYVVGVTSALVLRRLPQRA